MQLKRLVNGCRRWPKVLFVTGLFGSVCHSAIAEDVDAYMDVLTEEAARVDTTSIVRAAGAPQGTELAGVLPHEPGDLPAKMQMSSFESLLKDEYLGSYTFYQRLSASRKVQAYESYLADANIDAVRKRIMNLFMSR